MYRHLISLFLFLVGTGAFAAPEPYLLDRANSIVSYSVAFGQDEVTGNMPVADSEIALDFVQDSRSAVRVVLNAAAATASFPFAEQALKGPKVLATGQFPTITFDSRNIEMQQSAAVVDGQVTIRGVTRPIRLAVQVYRQQGTDAGDLSKIAVHIAGKVNRSEFGATGWSDMVGDVVAIEIVARLNRAP